MIRSDISGSQPALFPDHCRMYFFSDMVPEFRFIDFHIASEKYNYISVIGIFLIDHCLTGTFHLSLQEPADIFYGFFIRRFHFYKV